MAFIFTLTAVQRKPCHCGSMWTQGSCPCLGSAWPSKVLQPHRCGTETAKITLEKKTLLVLGKCISHAGSIVTLLDLDLSYYNTLQSSRVEALVNPQIQVICPWFVQSFLCYCVGFF